MKLNQVHLYAINKLFRFFQILGLSLWKVEFIGSSQNDVKFSVFGLIFSIVFTSIIICAIIYQHSKIKIGIDSVLNTSITHVTRNIQRFLPYMYFPAIYLPAWILAQKVKKMFEKLIFIKETLNQVSEKSLNALKIQTAAIILLETSVLLILTTLEFFYGIEILQSQNSDDEETIGISWDTIVAFVAPRLLKNLSLLYFLCLIRIISTRFQQIQGLLQELQ